MTRSIRTLRLTSALLGLALALTTRAAHAQARIVLDPTQTYQTMSGWEATAEAGQLTTSGANYAGYRDALLALAVNDLGITRLRIEVPSGTEGQGLPTPPGCYQTINDNSNPNVINWSGYNFSRLDTTIQNLVLPMKALVEANHEPFFVNVTYVRFNASTPDMFATNAAEYAELVLAVHLHLKNTFGLRIDTWEVVLEPENDPPFTGQLIGNEIVQAGALLRANGFMTKFVVPSNTDMANAITYYDQLISVPGAKSLVAELSYHRYGGVSDSNLSAIGQRAARDGIRSSMLEHIGSSVDDLYKDLTLARNSAWQQYVLAFPGTTDTGATYYGIANANAAQPTVVMMSRTKLLRQYFKFIRPGAVRYSAMSNDARLSPVAFTNPSGKAVVVVQATAASAISIASLPAGRYGINYSTDTAYNRSLPEQVLTAGQSLTTSIPAAGVITIYGIAKLAPVSAGGPYAMLALAFALLGLAWLTKLSRTRTSTSRSHAQTNDSSASATRAGS